jgi:hypothetical protein
MCIKHYFFYKGEAYAHEWSAKKKKMIFLMSFRNISNNQLKIYVCIYLHNYLHKMIESGGESDKSDDKETPPNLLSV